MIEVHQLSSQGGVCSFEVEGSRLRVTKERSKASFFGMRGGLLLFIALALAFSWSGISDFGDAALQGDPFVIFFACLWILMSVSFVIPLILVFSLPRVLTMEFDAEQGLSTSHAVLRFWARGKKGLVLDMDIYPTSLGRNPKGELRGGFLVRPSIADTKRGLLGLRQRGLKKFFPLAFGALRFDSPAQALEEARALKRFLRKHRLPIPVLIEPHSRPASGD